MNKGLAEVIMLGVKRFSTIIWYLGFFHFGVNKESPVFLTMLKDAFLRVK